MLRKLIYIHTYIHNKVIAYTEINIKMTIEKRGGKSERGGEEGRERERRKGEKGKGEKRRE